MNDPQSPETQSPAPASFEEWLARQRMGGTDKPFYVTVARDAWQAASARSEAKLEELRKKYEVACGTISQMQDERSHRDSFAVLAGLSSWLSQGSGAPSTSAQEYDKRIREGVDSILAVEVDRREKSEARIRELEAAITHGDIPSYELLEWLADRLVHVLQINPGSDFILAARDKAKRLRDVMVKSEAKKAEPPLKWQKERADAAQGLRIQQRPKGSSGEWTDCPIGVGPSWLEQNEYRTHLDDQPAKPASEAWVPKAGEKVELGTSGYVGVVEANPSPRVPVRYPNGHCVMELVSSLRPLPTLPSPPTSQDRCPTCGSLTKDHAHPENDGIPLPCTDEWHTSTPQPPAVWPTMDELKELYFSTGEVAVNSLGIENIRSLLIQRATTLLAEQGKRLEAALVDAERLSKYGQGLNQAMCATEEQLAAERTAHNDTTRHLQQASGQVAHLERIARERREELTTANARAEKAEDMFNRDHASLINALGERDTALAKVAELEKKLASSGWIALSERRPTEEDGDEDGDVLWRDSYSGRVTMSKFDQCPDKDCIHWMSIPPLPAPQDPELSRFEKWWTDRCAQPASHKNSLKEAMQDAWKAAKEGNA